MARRRHRRAVADGLRRGDGCADVARQFPDQKRSVTLARWPWRDGALSGQVRPHAAAAIDRMVGLAKDSLSGRESGVSGCNYASLLLGAIPVDFQLVVSEDQTRIKFRAGSVTVAISRRACAGGGTHLHIIGGSVGEYDSSPIRVSQPAGEAWVSRRRGVRTAGVEAILQGLQRLPLLRDTSVWRSSRPGDPQPSMAGNRPPQRPLRNSTSPSA